jgi:hypothetical protein
MITSLLRRHKQQASNELKNRKPDMIKGETANQSVIYFRGTLYVWFFMGPLVDLSVNIRPRVGSAYLSLLQDDLLNLVLI